MEVLFLVLTTFLFLSTSSSALPAHPTATPGEISVEMTASASVDHLPNTLRHGDMETELQDSSRAQPHTEQLLRDDHINREFPWGLQFQQVPIVTLDSISESFAAKMVESNRPHVIRNTFVMQWKALGYPDNSMYPLLFPLISR